MSEQFQQKIMEYIDAIAHGIGVASQFVFDTLVKQKLIEGCVDAGLYLVALTAYLIILPKVFKWMKISVDKNGWGEPQVFSCLGVIAVSVALIFFSFLVLPDTIMQIFNPQYYALKDILDAVKGK